VNGSQLKFSKRTWLGPQLLVLETGGMKPANENKKNSPQKLNKIHISNIEVTSIPPSFDYWN
jgi:hypothetical protein